MLTTTKRQKTAQATYFPKRVFAHILSYCEDPMILYTRQHAKVWRTIGMRFAVRTDETKIYATVNGKKKSRLYLGRCESKIPTFMLEYTNYHSGTESDSEEEPDYSGCSIIERISDHY